MSACHDVMTSLAATLQPISVQKAVRSSYQGMTDEHHRLPDRLPRSVTVVVQGERPRVTTTVTARKPPLLEERLGRCRRHNGAEPVQRAGAVRQKELVSDSNGMTKTIRLLRKKAPQPMTSRKSFHREGAVDVPYRIGDRSSHCEPTARLPPRLKAVSTNT